MKKCLGCNIYFNTSKDTCPLCQNVLEKGEYDKHFPQNIHLATTKLITKIILFVTIATFLITAFLELLISHTIHYNIYIFLGLLTNYVITSIIINNYQNVYRIFSRYISVVNILLLFWYFVTHSPVITNYIIPSVCLFGVFFDLIVSLIIRKNYIIKYKSQIILNIILLFLPIILVLLKLTTNNILAYICILVSLISSLGFLIFSFDDIKEELRKLFNV